MRALTSDSTQSTLRPGGIALALTAAAPAALLALALIAPAPSGTQQGCQGADREIREQGIASAEYAVLCLTNVERTERGRDPLFDADTLARAARDHAEDMVQHGYFSHTGRDGSEPHERIRRAGYPPEGA